MPSYSGVFTLQAQMQAIAASNWPSPPLVIGQAYAGGYYAGQISTSGNGIATHNLVIGPISSAESSAKKWNTDNGNITGTSSTIDGPANTAAMVAYGSPCEAGIFCDNLTIGGFSDWYMPAKNELEVCYYNLKPTTTSNQTGSGINANAVPARASNYTAGSPAQTSATDFITSTGAQAFTASSIPNAYWASTQTTTASIGVYQNFSSGYQDGTQKNQNNRVRAVRRVAV
jgi:hypothetical protein